MLQQKGFRNCHRYDLNPAVIVPFTGNLSIEKRLRSDYLTGNLAGAFYQLIGLRSTFLPCVKLASTLFEKPSSCCSLVGRAYVLRTLQ